MESGATYNRAEIYSLFSAIIFPFFNDPIVGLRFHNLILYIFSIPLIYILSKKVLKSKNIALFSTFFIATNWFFLILSLTARNYVYGIILVAILMYLCLHLYENKKNNNLTYFLITLFLFFNYFEGVLIYSLHFLIFLFLVELIKGNITIKKALIALFFGIISFFVLVVTFKSSILFILDSFKINLTKIYLEAIIFNGSMIYSLPLIGLSFILISILFCWNYKNNKNLKIIALFPLLIVILQVTIFSDGRSYPRYFGDLIIPILILISFWTYSYLKSYKKIIFLILVTVILLTSLINISSVFNQKLGYSFYQPSNWEKLLNDIPKNAVIITDSPNTVKILLPNQIIYGLRDNPLDSELVYWDGIHYNEDTQEKDPKFKSDWQVNYFKLIDLNEYILCDKNKQLFFYYDKTPKIMSIEQLIEINQKNQVYFVLTHNYLGKTNQKDNTQLYLFIKENSILVAGGEKQKKFAFDFRDFDETNINSSLVSVLKLNSQFQKNN